MDSISLLLPPSPYHNHSSSSSAAPNPEREGGGLGGNVLHGTSRSRETSTPTPPQLAGRQRQTELLLLLLPTRGAIRRDGTWGCMLRRLLPSFHSLGGQGVDGARDEHQGRQEELVLRPGHAGSAWLPGTFRRLKQPEGPEKIT